MNSLQGHFLVASPHLSDPNFFRSVVLMVQHDKDGAFGLILNRPTESTLSDVWDLISDEPCSAQYPINHGGPVEGPLTVVHTDASCSENEICSGVYFTARKENLLDLVEQVDHSVRVFAGYAGWAGGQLENEIEKGGWLTTPATTEDVFDDDSEMWKRIVRRIGLEILAPSIKKNQVPEDPSVN